MAQAVHGVSATTDVDSYPVRLGSTYHGGKPDEPGKDWYGTVTGLQPPGSLDFHHGSPCVR